MIPTGYHGNFFLEKAPAKPSAVGFTGILAYARLCLAQALIPVKPWPGALPYT
jgi:hypothetical protein